MPHPARVLFLLVLALPSATAGAQTTLNKCIDARGFVTYTNKPCVNAHEARRIEIDSSPAVEALRVTPAAVTPARADAARPPEPANTQLETRKTTGQPALQKGSAGQCETLSEQLGRVLDKMDQARRKGYTQAQMDKWNEEARALERKKQLSACF